MSAKVSSAAMEERAQALNRLSAEMHRAFYEKNISRAVKVLFESTRRKGMISGFTENYIKVETAYDETLVGQIVKGVLSGISETGNATIELTTSK
jgi:threonylcarbamoyladenosine tRNA methylthiotransferase MtaB